VIGAFVWVSTVYGDIPMTKLRHGHAPGHVRNTFEEAVEVFCKWDGRGPEPEVDFEVNYVPRSITISEAARLLWHCTDIMPSWMRDILEEYELKSGTYAAGARALLYGVERLMAHRLAKSA
jgi:hypothetical protein